MAPRYGSFGGFDLNLTSYVCAREGERTYTYLEGLRHIRMSQHLTRSLLRMRCVLMKVSHNKSPLQMRTWISTILSTPTSGDLEHVMAMTSHVATGLEAKIDHSNTHSCSAQFRSLGTCVVSWCFTCPHNTRGSHEDKLCRSLSFLHMYDK